MDYHLVTSDQRNLSEKQNQFGLLHRMGSALFVYKYVNILANFRRNCQIFSRLAGKRKMAGWSDAAHMTITLNIKKSIIYWTQFISVY